MRGSGIAIVARATGPHLFPHTRLCRNQRNQRRCHVERSETSRISSVL